MQYFQAVQEGKKRANEAQMKLFDVDPNEQTLTDDTPVYDKTPAGEGMAKFKDWNI